MVSAAVSEARVETAAGSATVVANVPRFHRVLVAIDDSEAAVWAIQTAYALAGQLGAQIALVHCVEIFPVVDPQFILPVELEENLRKAGDALLRERRRVLPETVSPELFRCEGRPADEIVATARRWHADLILIGSHARGRVAQFLLGSVARELIQRAPCPVLVVAHDPNQLEAGTANAHEEQPESAGTCRHFAKF
jgi:nucleotide-binding universal stress UspA family protein